MINGFENFSQIIFSLKDAETKDRFLLMFFNLGKSDLTQPNLSLVSPAEPIVTYLSKTQPYQNRFSRV